MVKPPYSELKLGETITVTFTTLFYGYQERSAEEEDNSFLNVIDVNGEFTMLDGADVKEVTHFVESFEVKPGDIYVREDDSAFDGVWYISSAKLEFGGLAAYAPGALTYYASDEFNFRKEELVYRKASS